MAYDMEIGPNDPQPYIDFQVGSTINGRHGERVRVLVINASQDEPNELRFTVTVESVREHIAELMRSAREFVAAYVSSEELGDTLWQQLAQNFGDKFEFKAVTAVGSVAAGAVARWSTLSGDPYRELIRDFVVTVDPEPQTQQATAVVSELLRKPRDQERLNACVATIGQDQGVYALGALAGVAFYALMRVGQLTSAEPLEVLQDLALLDEQSLMEKGED